MSPRTEQELLDATIALAETTRWAVHHDRPARTGAGWRTAISGNAGFPDLVLARGGLVLFRELKGYDSRGRMGRLSSEQRDWAIQLQPVIVDGDVVEGRKRLLFDVWTPDDWPLIVATLTARPERKTA